MKRLQVFSAIAVLSLATLVGCGKKEDEEPVDKTKAQLTISTYEGGVGKKWLENAARLPCCRHRLPQRGEAVHVRPGRNAAGSADGG